MFADDALSRTGREDYLAVMAPQDRGEAARWPGAHAIKRGEAGEFPRVGEDMRAWVSRGQDCFEGLRPSNGWHGWLVDQISFTTLRLDRCGRADRRLRDCSAIRAGSNWDEDRMIKAEAAGKRIAELPHAIVADLRSTPHGCDWLIRRWAILGMAAETKKGWTAAQVDLAFDLLGTPQEDREGEPGRTFEGKSGTVAVVPDRDELARREIAALKRRKAEVAHWDAINRAMAEADLVVEPNPESRMLTRHETQLRTWLKWLIAQVRLGPPDRHAPADLYPELPKAEPETTDQPQPGTAPETRAAAPSTPEAESDADPLPSDTGDPLPRIAGSTRKDPKEAREAAKAQARRLKQELRRA